MASKQKILPVVLGIALFVIIGTYYFDYEYAVKELNKGTVIPLIILKLPRSGSSWFTENLNNFPSIYISKEIMQFNDVGQFSNKEIENHLVKALHQPTDKLSASRSWLPTGRYISDYVKSLKFLSSFRIVGFTLNIEHSYGIDWQRVIHRTPHVKVVELVRTNVVKMAISDYRGRIMHRICGVSNAGDGDSRVQDCIAALPRTVPWNVTDFAYNVNWWQKRAHLFNVTVLSMNMPVLEMYYEDLQAYGGDNEYQKLFSYLGGVVVNTNMRGGSSGTWQKRTSDDLSKVLDHYDDIEKYLKSINCECILAQLTATAAKRLPSCYVEIDTAANVCRSLGDHSSLTRESLLSLRPPYSYTPEKGSKLWKYMDLGVATGI